MYKVRPHRKEHKAIKFALCAKRFINNDLEHNLNVILQTLSEMPRGTDLVCFGESFLQGFDCLNWDFARDKAVAVRQDAEPILAIRGKAKELSTAVAFGYIELCGEALYSSYLIVSKKGEVACNFRRVSTGWKEPVTDPCLYKEGNLFPVFTLEGKRFTVGLCGDFWDDENVAAIAKNDAEITLWPVYLDYSAQKWNEEKLEYAQQARRLSKNVLLINSVCDGEEHAKGAAAYFKDGRIAAQTLPGRESVLFVEL